MAAREEMARIRWCMRIEGGQGDLRTGWRQSAEAQLHLGRAPAGIENSLNWLYRDEPSWWHRRRTRVAVILPSQEKSR